MAFFTPTGHVSKVTDITLEMLNKLSVDTLLLDIDNTLKPYGAQLPADGVMQWISYMKDNGIKLIVCSNNYKRNVEPFAQKLGLPYVHMCLKPSPFGFIRAKHKLKSKRKNMLVVGDQLFTDIFGASNTFIKSLLVEPIRTDGEAKTVALRRTLEQRHRNKILQRKNPF